MHFVQPDGRVRSRVLDGIPYASNLHDCWLTEQYLILPVQPFIQNKQRVDNGLAILGWDPSLPTVLAIIPRSLDGEVRYIQADFEAQYVMHTMSANTGGDVITLDGPIYAKPPFPFEQDLNEGDAFPAFPSAYNGHWILDLAAGTVTSEQIDDRPVEFPKVDERFYGKPYEHGWLTGGPNLWSLTTLLQRNVKTGSESAYEVKRDTPFALFEPTFAPRYEGAPEGDGFVIVPLSRYMENTSEFLLFDTSDISQGPVAEIEMPFQIGWTPHGHYMDFNRAH
jgi:carotenoid cleavage dioxygenase